MSGEMKQTNFLNQLNLMEVKMEEEKSLDKEIIDFNKKISQRINFALQEIKRKEFPLEDGGISIVVKMNDVFTAFKNNFGDIIQND